MDEKTRISQEEVKNGAHKFLLWWNTVSDVVQQGLTETESGRYSHPLLHVFVCLFLRYTVLE